MTRADRAREFDRINRLGRPTAAECKFALRHMRREEDRVHPRDPATGRFRARAARA